MFGFDCDDLMFHFEHFNAFGFARYKMLFWEQNKASRDFRKLVKGSEIWGIRFRSLKYPAT